MKRIYWLMMLMITSVAMVAQTVTQQGVVKTRGRMVNGKHVAGKGLSGATVQVKGRSAVVSRQNGAFSFPVPSQSFMVQSVTKQGYRLVDDDATRKPYQHSTNPIYLVMETPEQQTQDQLDAERKLRRTLQRQLQQREDEIEAMSVSLQEKQRMLQQLYQDQQNNEKLIADMAKQYAAMDYDQMDALNQRISDAILNGRLTEADSLLRSKGDMNDRIAEIRREQQAEAQEEADLTKRQENLAASKAGTQRKLEDAASDCYKFFDRFKLANQHDSAAYYIELRAALDTTNVKWQNEAGELFLEYKVDIPKVKQYFDRALHQAIAKYGRLNELTALSYLNRGRYFQSQIDIRRTEEYFHEALLILKKLYGENNLLVAKCYFYLGSVLKITGYSLTCYNKALDIQLSFLGEQHPDVAETYNNIGYYYFEQKDYTQAMEYYEKALKIWETTLGKEHAKVATSYNNIAMIYYQKGKYTDALVYQARSLTIDVDVFGFNHPQVATDYNNIGMILYQLGNYDESLKCLQKALDICERIYGKDHLESKRVRQNILKVKKE